MLDFLTHHHFGWLVLAGIGGGLAGSMAGLASLISYPALLAAGLPAVSANVSNTVALVFNSVGSVTGSRPELRGHWRAAAKLAAVGSAGGICGAALLLLTPSSTFEFVVPWLIALGSLAIFMRPDHVGATAGTDDPAHARWPPWLLPAGVFAIGIYGGYFGAAAGVLMLALLMAGTGDSIYRSNAKKNVILGAANAIAAIAFVLFGSVRWWAVVPLAIGCLIGGRLGPTLIRHVPAKPLRYAIAIAGLALAVHLGFDAYHL